MKVFTTVLRGTHRQGSSLILQYVVLMWFGRRHRERVSEGKDLKRVIRKNAIRLGWVFTTYCI